MAKVLIVDDSPTVVRVLSRFLEQQGYECVSASDGASGYQAARETRPDLVLMDVIMGEHNGFHACRKMKRDVITRSIPVVLLSSKTSETDQFWGLRMGASEYLHKPVAPEKLLETVVRLTGVKPSAAAPTPPGRLASSDR